MLLLPFILLSLVSASPWKSLSQSDLRAVVNQIRGVLDTAARSETGQNQASTAACWVRLAFHDCGTWTPSAGTGGCHAHAFWPCSGNNCERNADENKGLPPCIDLLEQAYQNTAASPPPFSVMSRADFWHLASATAIAYTSGDSCTISFQFGRTDAMVAKRFSGMLPGGMDSIAQLRSLFINRLGFTFDQMVCLFGAHSLGQAKSGNSGFNGQWVPNGRNFSNVYFQVLTENHWDKVSTGSNHQWHVPKGDAIMLDTDLLPMWDVSSQGCPQAKVTLDSAGCALTSTSSIVEGFAADNRAFCSCFQGAFQKLLGFGGDRLANPGSTINQPSMSTSVSVTASQNPAPVGGTVTITVTVTAAQNNGYGGVPVGTVTFTDNGSQLGSAILLLKGSATMTLRSLSSGQHNLVVTFTPDSKTSFLSSSGSLVLSAGTNGPPATPSPTTTPSRTTTAPVPSRTTAAPVPSRTTTAPITQKPTAPPSNTASATTCQISFTSQGQFSLVVSAAGKTVTGGVTFTSDGATINRTPLQLSGGSTSLLISPPLSVGSHLVAGNYQGSSSFQSCSASVRVLVSRR